MMCRIFLVCRTFRLVSGIVNFDTCVVVSRLGEPLCRPHALRCPRSPASGCSPSACPHHQRLPLLAAPFTAARWLQDATRRFSLALPFPSHARRSPSAARGWPVPVHRTRAARTRCPPHVAS